MGIKTELDSELHPSRLDIAKLVVIGAVQAVTIVASVLILRRLVDQLNAGAPTAEALQSGYWFAAAGILLAITRGIEYSVAEGVGYRLVAHLRMFLFGHLVDLPARVVQRASQGAVLLRFTGDLSTYRTWISRGLSRGIVSSFTVLGALGVLVVIDPIIALSVVTMLLFGAAASALWGYQVRRSTRAVRWRRSLLTSNVAEQIRSLAVVQVFGRKSGETARLAEQNEDLLQSLYRAASARAALRFLSSAAGTLAVGAVLMVGILQLERQLVTIGGVVAAMTAARFLTGPVRTLGRSHEYWQAAQVSKRKLQDFLQRPTRLQHTSAELERLRPREGRIEFCDVSVAGALEHVSFTVEPGDLVAVMGDNGAGKSTLLSLVARLNRPDTGTISVDEQSLAECTFESTARNVGMVSPDLPLMRGTLRRNLTYRYGQANDALLQQAILSCRIDELLDSVDGGLSEWIIEGGTNLATGHRQRIMLARATLGNPRVLLLDEPTTNLDAATKEVFRRVISRYNGTIMLVTHDPVEASLADHVVIMDSGQISRQMTGEEFRAEMTLERRMEAGRPKW